jgi:hypothetical protein
VRVSTPARAALRLAAEGAPHVPDEDGQQVDALAHAQAKLRLPGLRRVIKRGTSDSLFDLELDDGTLIEVGPIGALKDPRQIEDRLADTLGVLPPYYRPAAFRSVANALLAIAETVDDGLGAGTVTRAWIGAYLHDRLGATLDLETPEGRRAAVHHREPFRDTTGRLYLPLEGVHGFERFVVTLLRQRASTRELAARLARLGFQREQVSTPRPERKRASFHVSPADFDPEDGT